MANLVSLSEYLQHAPPTLPVVENDVPTTRSNKNTTSRSYKWSDILHCYEWREFNLQTIEQQYGNLLASAQIPDEPMPTSPPHPITSEDGFRDLFSVYLYSRVKRSLRCGFENHRASRAQLVVGFGSGSLAQKVEGSLPDLAFFDSNREDVKTRTNLVPGEIKPSFKWAHTRNDGMVSDTQFKQVLSQLNWYMCQHNTRYGFIITDKELVPVRRRGEKGHLDLAASIPWEAQGRFGQRELTVLLAL